jgi:hypothetical protein
MAELNPQPLPPGGGQHVRVYVPADVTYDLAKMQKVTANVLGRLGCGGCHSGRILDFVTLQDYVVHPQTLEVQPVTTPQGT